MPNRTRAGLIVAIIVIIGVLAYVTTSKRASTSQAALRIGSILILSGQYASYGEQFRDGATLGIQRANENRALRPVEIRFVDSGGAQDKARELVRTMHERDGIRYLADVMGSPLTLATAPEFNALQMVTVSGTSTAPDLSWKGGQYFFRIVPSDGVAAEHVAAWAISKGWKRAVVLHDTDDWGSGLTAALKHAYETSGGTIVASLDCPKGFQLFPSLAAQIEAAKPDVIFLFVYPREAGLLLKAARAAKLSTPVMGTDNFTGEEMRELAGPAFEGAMYVLPGSAGHGPQYEDLRRRYTAAKRGADAEPSLFVMTGYDVSMILADVGRRFGDDTPGATAYLHTHNFSGASGNIAFAPNGDVVVSGYQRFVVARTENGTLTPKATER